MLCPKVFWGFSENCPRASLSDPGGGVGMPELIFEGQPSLLPLECGPSTLWTVQSSVRHRVKDCCLSGLRCSDPTKSLPDALEALIPKAIVQAPTIHGPEQVPEQQLLTLVLLEGLHQILQG